MNLIITMAGRYRRFRDAGYSTPKYLLSWHGSSILAHVLSNLLQDQPFDQVLVVANRRDAMYQRQIEAVLESCGIDPERLVFIGDTDGQATTALIGIELLDEIARPTDRRVVVHNVDTLVRNRDMNAVASWLACSEGWIDTFPANDPAFSYVRIGTSGWVDEIVEKQVISPWATSGLYAFANADHYRRLVQDADAAKGELYISDVYRTMIERGERIAAGGSDQGDTLVFGTPEQYEALCQQDAWAGQS